MTERIARKSPISVCPQVGHKRHEANEVQIWDCGEEMGDFFGCRMLASGRFATKINSPEAPQYMNIKGWSLHI